MDEDDIQISNDSEQSCTMVTNLPPGYVKNLVSTLENTSGFLKTPELPISIKTKPDLPPKPVFDFDQNKQKNSDNASKQDDPEESESQAEKSNFFSWRRSFNKTKKKLRESSLFYSSDSSELAPPDFAIPNGTSDQSPSNSYGVFGNEGKEATDFVRLDAEISGADSQRVVDNLEEDAASAPLEKSYQVARELLTSEQVYVSAIKLLNVDFRHYIRNNCHGSKVKVISESDLNKVLQHLPELQVLNDDLLNDIKCRIDNWQQNPKIADVLVKKGAFLKLYSTYLKNFKNQTEFLDECCSKSLYFQKLVKEFEALDICKKLTLKNYMLKPVQRIAQYKLLFRDYFKNLTEDSIDYEDTLKALELVTDVLEHVNNSMKIGDQAERMIQLQSMLGNFQLIEPGRELIKDGQLQKVCRKTVQDRYFILLNDCLLYATLSKTYLSLHRTLLLGGMEVAYREDDDPDSYTFSICSRTKSVLLRAKSEAERREWCEALQNTIESYISRKMSFMPNAVQHIPDSFILGKSAPIWIPDNKVTMCQQCTAEFTKLYRRHHCRACGKIYCWKCSDNRAPIQYDKYIPDRVCDKCFQQLLQDFEKDEESIKKSLTGTDGESADNAYMSLKSKFIASKYLVEPKQKKNVPRRLTEVSAQDAGADISGWLKKWNPNKFKWEKNWYVLKNMVMYVYAASEDIVASQSIPVLGYKVAKGHNENLDGANKEQIFQVTHKQRPPMIFWAQDFNNAERWAEKLNDATYYENL